MKRLLILLVSAAATGAAVAADETCVQPGPQDAVRCYVQQVRQAPLEVEVLDQHAEEGYEFRRYRMVSQDWAPAPATGPREWTHNVEMHIPADALHRKALLVVNNGVLIGDEEQTPDYPRDELRAIAQRTRSVVIMVDHVPNQYVMFSDTPKALREDDAVAHTWAHWMRDPAAPSELPLHVPMAAAVSRTMDLAEQALAPLDIREFMLTGASKRGWAAWLVAVTDSRVVALVPTVIDVSDTTRMLEDLRKRYGGHWPAALFSYFKSGVLQQIGGPDFARLMAVMDPLSYLESSGSRLSIPKYLVSASGDDFFAPDADPEALNRLPGELSLRVLPNADHGGARAHVATTLVPFIKRIQAEKALPRVDWQPNGAVEFSEPPVSVQLWTADNEVDRDFRYACGVRYHAQPLAAERFAQRMSAETPISGWKASFIEATFADGYVATTPVRVRPETFPDHPPTQQAGRCRSFSG